MSLDISLSYFIKSSVFDYNITHNLAKMADAADLYQSLWRPDELNIKIAKDLIPFLESGLYKLKEKPDYFKQFNPPNNWGSYESLILFVEQYLQACRNYPEAEISVSR